jgi:hypothetical protein
VKTSTSDSGATQSATRKALEDMLCAMTPAEQADLLRKLAGKQATLNVVGSPLPSVPAMAFFNKKLEPRLMIV